MKRTAFSPHEELYVHHLKTSQKHNMSVQHYHDAYEIYFQLEGRRYCFVDNICYTLEPGDLMIYKPFDLHYSESRDVDYYERYVLNFHTEALSILLSNSEINMLLKKLGAGVSHLSEDQRKIVYAYYEEISKYSLMKGFLAEKLTYSAVLQFLMYIVNHVDIKNTYQSNVIAPQIIIALEYINNHYKEKISLDEIAHVANMSKYYFCRTFRTVTGATVFEYINNVRLIKVHNLLIHTQMPIEEIAAQTGFGVGTSLTRAFKKDYGMSPRSFRNMKQNKSAENNTCLVQVKKE